MIQNGFENKEKKLLKFCYQKRGLKISTIYWDLVIHPDRADECVQKVCKYVIWLSVAQVFIAFTQLIHTW